MRKFFSIRSVFFLGLLALCALIIVSFYRLFLPVSIIHYRLEVTFEVDGTPVTGSSVQKLTVERVRGSWRQEARWRAEGDAVRVELAGHGAVYVLLASPTADGTFTSVTKGKFSSILYHACDIKEKREGKSWSEMVRMVGKLEGTCEILERDLPLMVYFEDEKIPTTVKRVKPENVSASLGDEILFVGANLTVTDAPVTSGIDKWLPWLNGEPEQRLDATYRGSANPTLSQTLQYGYFSNFRK